MVQCFTAGGIIIDNVAAADGRVRRGQMGGNAIYSAAGARLWVDAVGVVGVVPRNYPARWLDAARAAGLDLDGVHEADEEVFSSEWFFYKPDGARTDHLHADEGAFERFGLAGDRISAADAARFMAWMRAQPDPPAGFGAFRRRNPVLPAQVPAAYAAAFGAHLGANLPDAQRRMAEDLTGRGLVVTLDPGSNAAAMAPDVAQGRLPPMAAFLPSETEAAALVGPLAPEIAAARLVASGAPLVALKLGSRGALLAGRDLPRPVAIPVAPVRAIDPTGAGDAFCGGFLAGLVRTHDPVAAACLGAVSASFAVEDFGPWRLLGADRREARARLLALAARLPHDAAATAAPAIQQLLRD
ncbi:hypothetical protein GCM10007036_19640 [Alsobacter metallidurans]|uniref:Carbohydrate kinase PfkB domain-containing protein n=1 Tax=Alsobacter metallidurans TaxID=340221 RepID=A0A917I7K5_9HYPH|nr:PfkB family carbohydrate kinase [Alsobacter metallidurans]GGH17859.1 hypothetical protein GCM10007036_19640 [Alsobacter metallidurans]